MLVTPRDMNATQSSFGSNSRYNSRASASQTPRESNPRQKKNLTRTSKSVKFMQTGESIKSQPEESKGGDGGSPNRARKDSFKTPNASPNRERIGRSNSREMNASAGKSKEASNTKRSSSLVKMIKATGVEDLFLNYEKVKQDQMKKLLRLFASNGEYRIPAFGIIPTLRYIPTR